MEVTVNLPEAPRTGPSRLEVIERIAKIFSSVAIPVILAVLGFFVNAYFQNQTAQREYVTLAVKILQESDPAKSSLELKEWAADLLEYYSPVGLPLRLRVKLQSGAVVLPGELPACGITASPGTIRRGESTTLNWSSTNAISVQISPDIGLVTPTGYVNVSPNETTTYTVTATNASGVQAKAAVTVIVTTS